MYEYSQTAQALLVNILKKHRDRIFTKTDGGEFYYSDVDKMSNKLAHALNSLGCKKKDRAAIILPNGIDYAVSYFGVLKSGIPLIPLNMNMSVNDVAFILEFGNAGVVITDISYKEKIDSIKARIPGLMHIIVMGGDPGGGYLSWDSLVLKQPEEEIAPHVSPDDDAFVAFTGGTTGKPKGVMHSQTGLYFDAIGHSLELPMLFDEKILLATPMSHAAGMLMLAGAVKGAAFVIEKSFDPNRILQLIEKEKVTMTFMVPTIIYMFLDLLKQKDYDLKSLRIVLYGAAPMSDVRLTEAIKKFGNVFVQKYGQVECPDMIATLSIDDHIKAQKSPHILQSCGRPDIMVFLRIVDDNDKALPVGQVGEIVVKAPYVMKGYLNQPELTATTIKNGWLHTGDMGRVDEEGYVYIVDRKKDMIITGGMNVFPGEVEEVLRKHPMVKEISVIGIPDDKWGEAVTACIVPDGAVTKEEILKFSKDKLSKYAQPKNIIFKEQLPHTLLGKIDKKALRAPYWEGRTRGI